jgi:hypothetical protein
MAIRCVVVHSRTTLIFWRALAKILMNALTETNSQCNLREIKIGFAACSSEGLENETRLFLKIDVARCTYLDIGQKMKLEGQHS